MSSRTEVRVEIWRRDGRVGFKVYTTIMSRRRGWISLRTKD